MAKKLLAILAALCLVAAMGSVGASAALVYNPDTEAAEFYTNEYALGEFNILVIPDAHQTAEEDPNLIEYIRSAIKYGKTTGALDLVIFLGDSVTGSGKDNPERAVARLLAPVIEAEIPYTAVLGDEDPASLLDVWRTAGGTTKLTYMVEEEIEDSDPVEYEEVEKEVDVPLFVAPDDTGATAGNFKYTIKKTWYKDAFGDITGRRLSPQGNPNPLWDFDDALEGAQATAQFAQLFLFDIGSAASGYPYVRTDQITWFEDNLTPGLPALVFQHIPLPEVYTGGYFLKSPFNWALPWTRNVLDVNYCGTANYVNMVGTVLEAPKTPSFSDGEFAALEAEEVLAAFFGHDHMNNYVERFEKIDLVQLPGAAWNGGYGTYIVRGGSFVTLRSVAVNTTRDHFPEPVSSFYTAYASDYFTYRQASRVAGSQVASTVNGFNDFMKAVPFLLQNFLIDILAPIRWIKGGF